MRLVSIILTFAWIGITVAACTESEEELVQGKIIYQVDYPENKDNAFLIKILPSEMVFEFADGIQKSSIRNANLQNLTWADCNQSKMAFYFQYAEDAYKVELKQLGVNQMLKQMNQYSISYVDEHQTIAGFDCLKAIATDKGSGAEMELWYTQDLNLKHANWFTPFKEIDGVLIAFEMEQFGLRFSFKAKSFSHLNTGEIEAVKKMPSKGNVISFSEYNTKMTNLFSTFE